MSQKTWFTIISHTKGKKSVGITAFCLHQIIILQSVDKLAIQFSTSLNPRIASTLFSSANPQNVLKNISYVNEPIDEQLVKEVQAIIGDQMFVRWKNS